MKLLSFLWPGNGLVPGRPLPKGEERDPLEKGDALILSTATHFFLRKILSSQVLLLTAPSNDDQPTHNCAIALASAPRWCSQMRFKLQSLLQDAQGSVWLAAGVYPSEDGMIHGLVFLDRSCRCSLVAMLTKRVGAVQPVYSLLDFPPEVVSSDRCHLANLHLPILRLSLPGSSKSGGTTPRR